LTHIALAQLCKLLKFFAVIKRKKYVEKTQTEHSTLKFLGQLAANSSVERSAFARIAVSTLEKCAHLSVDQLMLLLLLLLLKRWKEAKDLGGLRAKAHV